MNAREKDAERRELIRMFVAEAIESGAATLPADVTLDEWISQIELYPSDVRRPARADLDHCVVCGVLLLASHSVAEICGGCRDDMRN